MITVNFKRNNHNNTFRIQIAYKKHTDLNPFSYDLYFSIVLNGDSLGNHTPVVNCNTNFCIPTLFDNRNLLYSILNHNWVEESNLNSVASGVEEIIEKIPNFVIRVLENTHNKILVYYGDYKIDMIYNINEFLANSELDFYKVYQLLKKVKGDHKVKKERYIFLTDVYFLLLDPVPSSKNLGKLLFWGDIRQIISCKGSSNDAETIILEWKNDNKILISFEMIFNEGLMKDFIENSNRKIIRLRDHYKIFQDDISKPSEEEMFKNKGGDTNIDKLLLLIKFKEELLETQHSVNIIRELMTLYQKVIEILSVTNGGDFKIYLDKLHSMLTNQEIQEKLEKENQEEHKIANLCELSESYDIMAEEENDEHEDY